MSSKPPVSTVDRPPGWLDGYPVDIAGGDLFGDAAAPVAARWKAVAEGLAGITEGGPSALQDAASRHVADLGLTFRVTGDEDERAWPLTVMPLVIGAAEWAEVERGLIQRATLLERLAADIYGPQRVVREGHLPAAVIAGSPFFARQMVGHTPRRGHFIHVYSVDLARGSRGQWRVLQDRVRIASGVGYALENRLAMSRTAGPLLVDNHARRLADFFARMRDGMAAACNREQPRIALLTPGRFNQTYAEQAHLARYLGLPLVEGRDLSVIDDRLYVGTIGGPKRVDAVWRWINTVSLDPLSFDAKSQLGVSNLFDAWSAGGVEMVNWPGAEVLESSAFAAFLPRLCRVLLDEAPILPNIATWWCGQAAESSIVAARLDELALRPAFGLPVEGLPSREPVAGADLDEAEREALLDALRRRPMDFCGQEIVHLSTTPAIIDGKIAPRPFTVRAFVARAADGSWTVMPGGFARLSSSSALPTSLMGAGDLSADVWIVDEQPAGLPAPLRTVEEPPISRGGGILASQAADNLYWFGRYNERAETVVRIVRALLGSSMEGDSGIDSEDGGLSSLVDLLMEFGAIDKATASQPAATISAKALTETRLPGGVAALMRRRLQVGLSLRERLARDFWRIVSRPMPSIAVGRPQSMLSSARWLTEHFSALAGLISENMVRSAAWRFIEIGQRIERAQAICRIAARLAESNGEGGRSGEALGVLLDLCDSQIIYRSRYLTGPMKNPVHDLVLLDPDNPRALKFQVAEIVDHLCALPSLRDDNIPEPPLRAARALLGELQAALAPDMTVERLKAIEGQLHDLSDEISARYFLHFDRDEAEKRTRLL
ncbi:circularly permuted type 2 ATP-grasp protein [Novosphingobium mangrovi (ex Huang et al. 2023)]|uniref:Circularly permuted type 2 ATP-grasp protein n=1 Tax=Novosphingobium mangrovi (ex Huang et al. 2023) TaxID=2976432 RepID=A0ABT2I616_9SPHN|nr:circularly permuted type 2 ATP-grasp protein [Novosphingobium mangrovi (ex Huang et al. 2023)]MCT2400251.1 circularly permuted type 2 ATP-grasp protein [Novosphingobium mangrovi (ex Huang et al. 2023)]